MWNLNAKCHERSRYHSLLFDIGSLSLSIPSPRTYVRFMSYTQPTGPVSRARGAVAYASAVCYWKLTSSSPESAERECQSRVSCVLGPAEQRPWCVKELRVRQNTFRMPLAAATVPYVHVYNMFHACIAYDHTVERRVLESRMHLEQCCHVFLVLVVALRCQSMSREIGSRNDAKPKEDFILSFRRSTFLSLIGGLGFRMQSIWLIITSTSFPPSNHIVISFTQNGRSNCRQSSGLSVSLMPKLLHH